MKKKYNKRNLKRTKKIPIKSYLQSLALNTYPQSIVGLAGHPKLDFTKKNPIEDEILILDYKVLLKYIQIDVLNTLHDYLCLQLGIEKFTQQDTFFIAEEINRFVDELTFELDLRRNNFYKNSGLNIT